MAKCKHLCITLVGPSFWSITLWEIPYPHTYRTKFRNIPKIACEHSLKHRRHIPKSFIPFCIGLRCCKLLRKIVLRIAVLHGIN